MFSNWFCSNTWGLRSLGSKYYGKWKYNGNGTGTMNTIAKRRVFTRTKTVRTLVLVLILVCIYLFETFPYLQDVLGAFGFNYIFKAVLWLSLALVVRFFPRTKPAARLRFRKSLKLTAFTCAIFYISLFIFSGFFEGFGKSPYSFTPLGILFNIILIGSILLGTELTRAYIINNLAINRPFIIISTVSLFFTFICIPFSQFTSLKTAVEGFRFAGDSVLPFFSEQIMASYFAYLGGPVTSMVYMGTLQAFRWFCPILPNSGWISKTLLGTFIPFLSLVIVQNFYLYQTGELKKGVRKKEKTAGWVVTSVLSVLIVWFAAGLFPIYPQVIATGSMEPLIKPGDVILVKKISGEDAKAGDIIHFRLKKVYVAHRVVSVNDKPEKSYKTKGDNNATPDSKSVLSSQVKGKVIYVVPKIGLPTLYVKSMGAPNTENVEI